MDKDGDNNSHETSPHQNHLRQRDREDDIVAPLITEAENRADRNNLEVYTSTNRWVYSANGFHRRFVRRCITGGRGGHNHDHDHDSGDANSSRCISNRHRRLCSNRFSNLGSISNLCSATLGAGALSLPYAFRLTGLVPGIALLIFSAYATIVSIDIIINSCVVTRLYQYEDVSVRLVGPRAGRALEASLLIFCFGTAVAYIVAMGDILDQALRSLRIWESMASDGEGTHGLGHALIMLYSRERVMISFWALVMFPLSLQRHVEGLQRVSSLGVLSIIFLALAAVIHSISHGIVIGKNYHSSQSAQHFDEQASLLWPNSFWDVVRAFPIIMFAFSCQVNVCAIFEEIAGFDNEEVLIDAEGIAIAKVQSKQRRMFNLTRYGITLCTILYLSIGIFGYLDFSHATLDNILKNYCLPVTHDPLMITASIFVAVALLVAFPFNILPARVTLKMIWDRSRKKKGDNTCENFLSQATGSDGLGCLSKWNEVAHGQEQWVGHGQGLIATNTIRDVLNFPSRRKFKEDDVVLDNLCDTLANQPLLDDCPQHSYPTQIPHTSVTSLSMDESKSDFSLSARPSAQCTSSFTEHFLLTLVLSGSALIVALLVPGISIVFGLMGGTASSIISFILPGMFLLGISRESMEVIYGHEDQEVEEGSSCLLLNGSSPPLLSSFPSQSRLSRWQKLLGWTLVWGGTLIGVLSTGVTLYGLFGGNHGGDVAQDICNSSGGSGDVMPTDGNDIIDRM